jgi:hypothetical protein
MRRRISPTMSSGSVCGRAMVAAAMEADDGGDAACARWRPDGERVRFNQLFVAEIATYTDTH